MLVELSWRMWALKLFVYPLRLTNRLPASFSWA
jgi:hypothetical protein